MIVRACRVGTEARRSAGEKRCLHRDWHLPPAGSKQATVCGRHRRHGRPRTQCHHVRGRRAWWVARCVVFEEIAASRNCCRFLRVRARARLTFEHARARAHTHTHSNTHTQTPTRRPTSRECVTPSSLSSLYVSGALRSRDDFLLLAVCVCRGTRTRCQL